jgi:hypothetical protein
MKEFINKVKDFFHWVSEKGVRVFVSILVLVFVVLPVIILVTIFALVNKPSIGIPYAVDSYSNVGGVSGSWKTVSFDDAVSKEAVFAPSVVIGQNASSPVLPFDKKIIKNGSLSLVVKNTEKSLGEIESIARNFEGFIENSNIYEISDGEKTGSVSLRVPSKNFSETLNALKKIAIKVSNETVSSNDVTAQYVDLEAEINNYKAEEKQYREIMARAVKIEDVLNVASRLADVRGKIDRAEAQLNYLARQVDMSTINVSLTGEAEVKVFGIVWRPLTIIKQSIKAMFADLAGFVDWLIRFLFNLPILVLKLAFGVLIIFVVVKVFKKLIKYFWK